MIGKLVTPLAFKIGAGIIAALTLALIVQTVRIEGALCRSVKPGEKPACIIQGFKQKVAVLRIDLDAARARTEAEIASHKATKRAYADAQAEAARMEAARLESIVHQQEGITDDVRQTYSADIAALRARYERLRKQAGGGAGAVGTSGGEPVPGVPASPSGIADNACNGIPTGELELRYCAAAQASQLRSLIQWNLKQHAVDPNRAAPPPASSPSVQGGDVTD